MSVVQKKLLVANECGAEKLLVPGEYGAGQLFGAGIGMYDICGFCVGGAGGCIVSISA